MSAKENYVMNAIENGNFEFIKMEFKLDRFKN